MLCFCLSVKVRQESVCFTQLHLHACKECMHAAVFACLFCFVRGGGTRVGVFWLCSKRPSTRIHHKCPFSQ